MSKKRKNTKRKKRIRGNPNINRIKSHKFYQGRYKIIWKKPRGAEGECSDPRDRQIWLNPNVDDRELLRIALDESYHASLWEIDNDVVFDIASSVGDFLYNLGFRLEKKS